MQELVQPIILLAGEGTRFKSTTSIHKPLINVNGKSILEWSLKTLDSVGHKPPIFVILKEHARLHQLDSHILAIVPNATVIQLDKPTGGNLDTALIGCKDLKGPVLFLDGDNYFDIELLSTKLSNDCCICCFHPRVQEDKWAFASINQAGRVLCVTEKQIPEGYNLPLMGMFYFKSADQFREVATEIIQNNLTTKGEFYMSQAVNKMCSLVDVGCIVAKWTIPLGTPEDVEIAKNLL